MGRLHFGEFYFKRRVVIMRMIIRQTLLVLALLVVLNGTAQAKKYKPINEIPKQGPESDEEQNIWNVGIRHQDKVRGTDELVNNPQLEQYLEGVVAKLMGDMVDDIGLEVDVLIFKDTTVNAWVYPNGTVAVQTGLLAALENEAQLAAILGHEVAHFLNRHAFIQIKAKQKTSFLGKGLGVLATAALAAKTGSINPNLINSGQIWTELVTSGYSRKLETAADAQGLQLMMGAGYPPNQAIPAFETMRQEEDDQVNVSKMWSSHPDIDARKKNLSKQIKKSKASKTGEGLDKQTYLNAVSLAVLSNIQLDVHKRKFDSAIEGLNNFTETLPNDARGYYFLGEAYRKKSPEGDFDQRIKSYQSAIGNDSSLAEPQREIGMAYRQQGNLNKARDAFTQYLNKNPNATDAPIIAWYRDNLDSSAAQ